LCEYERDFDKVDFAWRDQRFYVYDHFKFPDDQLKINLDAMRNFARGVGHFISTSKLNRILEPEPKAIPHSVAEQRLPQRPMKRIIWFRWGTYETYKFDARDLLWMKYDTDIKPDQIPPFKHLYFSSVVHLPEGRGAYLTGGSDEYDNFYRRTLHFKDYEKYDIVADMIHSRGHHCSVYLKKRNSVFVFGGNQGGKIQTIPYCEMLDIDMNAWLDRAQMHEPREGASACLFESSMMIFVFGGANLMNDQMDSIEQYMIDQNKWIKLEIRITFPVSHFITHALGKDKVLIMGTYNLQEVNRDTGAITVDRRPVQEIIDLSAQCQMIYPKTTVEPTYLPSFLDCNGILHVFPGTADNQPQLMKVNI